MLHLQAHMLCGGSHAFCELQDSFGRTSEAWDAKSAGSGARPLPVLFTELGGLAHHIPPDSLEGGQDAGQDVGSLPAGDLAAATIFCKSVAAETEALVRGTTKDLSLLQEHAAAKAFLLNAGFALPAALAIPEVAGDSDEHQTVAEGPSLQKKALLFLSAVSLSARRQPASLPPMTMQLQPSSAAFASKDVWEQQQQWQQSLQIACHAGKLTGTAVSTGK